MDLDNTIIDYDEAFEAIARREGMVSGDVARDKSAIRDHLRTRPGGEEEWRRLQALAYGREIDRAKAMPGALEFMKECRRRDIPVYVVSHKTERATADPAGPDLRECAVKWLAGNGFFGNETGLSAERVFFGATRTEKVGLIRELGCTDFIDDLEETFEEPDFPAGVRKFLFSRDSGTAAPGARGSWDDFLRVTITDPLPEDVLAAAAAILGAPLETVRAVTGGRNSRVYEAHTSGGRYALKQYFQLPNDPRDRLRTEYGALSLMRSVGITNVPAPIGLDVGHQFALYEWIAGESPGVGAATDSDIDDAVGFLAALRAVALENGNGWTTPASEARFSVAEVVANVEDRLRALERSPSAENPRSSFGLFVRQELAPSIAFFAKNARMSASSGVAPDCEIPLRDRTLSPSDFGFHNAIRAANGRLAFVDFEYFGWDDPGKTVCDFVLHPGMRLTEEQKRGFVRGAFEAFRDVSRLQERVAVLYPLFGLKWVLIILNEFLPEHLLRRDFAGLLDGGEDELLRTQLAKAEALLTRINSTRGSFPYS